MVSDFRLNYSLSAYDVGVTYSWEEGWNLLLGLIKRPETLTGAAQRNLPPMTTEAMLLIAVQHAVIDSIQVAKKDVPKKQKAKIPLPKAKSKTPVKQMTREEIDKKFSIFGGVN